MALIDDYVSAFPALPVDVIKAPRTFPDSNAQNTSSAITISQTDQEEQSTHITSNPIVYVVDSVPESQANTNTGDPTVFNLQSIQADSTIVAAATDSISSGSKADFIDLTEKQKTGGEPSITPTDQFKLPRSDVVRYSEYALRVVRKLTTDGILIGTELLISSPHIQKALRDLMSAYAFYNFVADPIVITKPYAPLFHYWRELRAYSKSEERSSEEKIHLEVLFEKFYPRYLGEAERIFADEIPKGKVRFEHLWTLFRAEDDVLNHTENYRELHRVMHCDTGVVEEKEVFIIYTWRWGYHNGVFGPCAETIIIPKFPSTCRIDELACFPIKLLSSQDQNEITEKLVKRGKKWKDLMRPTHQSYIGPMWVDPAGSRASAYKKLEISHMSGQIVLDHQLHTEHNPYLNDKLTGVHGYLLNGREVPDQLATSKFAAIRTGSDGGTRFTSRPSSAPKIIFNRAQCFKEDVYEMTDEQALLCPARARGFSLQEKKFAFFLVENVRPKEFRESSFHSLVLQARYKNTIRALVESHDPAENDFDDLIAGKGKGLILSLEGPPGSGKTLTAESIAELTHKPLYAISTSELGTAASRAEQGLQAVFKRAERWKAIVLLDEADLFLIKRSVGELDRNALVTVFLRTLEYFKGIMFLTSNRVEHFDPAFSSRIHLRVSFSDPDHKTRSMIWKNLLPITWDQAKCDRLAELNLNGRQIKNLIRTSILVSRYEKKLLSEEIIRDHYDVYHARETDTGLVR